MYMEEFLPSAREKDGRYRERLHLWLTKQINMGRKKKRRLEGVET